MLVKSKTCYNVTCNSLMALGFIILFIGFYVLSFMVLHYKSGIIIIGAVYIAIPMSIVLSALIIALLMLLVILIAMLYIIVFGIGLACVGSYQEVNKEIEEHEQLLKVKVQSYSTEKHEQLLKENVNVQSYSTNA